MPTQRSSTKLGPTSPTSFELLKKTSRGGEDPKIVFPSPSNKTIMCQTKYLKETKERFFITIDDKLYKPYNVRKAWDSYRMKTNFVDGANSILHQLNVGHFEATRKQVLPVTGH